MSRIAKLSDVIGKFHAVHGNRYGYQFVEYDNAKTKVAIWCRKCSKRFWQAPEKHMSGCGCPVCAKSKNANAMKKISEKNAASIVDEFKKVHGDKYDYSFVRYVGANKKVEIVCKTCGIRFHQKPVEHKRGAGCRKCAIRVAHDGVIEQKAKSMIKEFTRIHGDKYDYSYAVYCGAKNGVKIICKACGQIFTQTPDHHRQGHGCPICAMEASRQRLMSGRGVIRRLAGVRSNGRDVIQKFVNVHGSKYGYEFVEYVRSDKKVKIRCNKCGNFFWQNPDNHLQGQGCIRCGKIEGGKIRIEKESKRVLSKFYQIHGDKYDYSRVVYSGDKSLISIGCRKCGRVFKQSSGKHKMGHGCTYCKESKGERMVERVLQELGLPFEREKKFVACRNINPLPFDFYIFDNKGGVVIECHGEQHYRPVPFWGGMDAFQKRVVLDGIKKKFCEDKGIQYVEIPYGKSLASIRRILSAKFPKKNEMVAA